MILRYEGTDVTGDVSVAKCVWEARECGRVPSLLVEFEDAAGLWDAWSPQPGDRVSASAEGAPATGEMFVKSCEPVANGYRIRADALPVADARASRLWRRTTLSAVAAQIAGGLGLSCSFHGCDDMALAFARQHDERALAVLARICAMAGATFDVFGGSLHVVGRAWAEAQPSAGTLELSPESDYSYRRAPGWGRCTLLQGGPSAEGMCPDISASCGEGAGFSVELGALAGFPGSAELERAAAGVLADGNARRSGGHARAGALSPYTPGSRVTVSCPQSPSLSGEATVTRVRNDYANPSSKTWWRLI